ncbi:serine/threonine-protein kinase, putative [Theileria annulata]|uniref:non-specific serine/threonine protein kinase n=1 Tax=Theileria annulata TaxID=5874 RepID=Q4UAW2_THEAN|nr:serine/threonine-protein kinase, putative [Theileria annulata]CAI76039.1 serine/threonine-protein kinase, putative [Theileria annulata]|eukprot:XP_955515.1 serine/threonine-protein kinase, putative [Theileria annulata]
MSDIEDPLYEYKLQQKENYEEHNFTKVGIQVQDDVYTTLEPSERNSFGNFFSILYSSIKNKMTTLSDFLVLNYSTLTPAEAASSTAFFVKLENFNENLCNGISQGILSIADENLNNKILVTAVLNNNILKLLKGNEEYMKINIMKIIPPIIIIPNSNECFKIHSDDNELILCSFNEYSRNSWWLQITKQILCNNKNEIRNEIYGESTIEEQAKVYIIDIEHLMNKNDKKGINIHIDGNESQLPQRFLITNDPKISLLSEKPKESDKTLGIRKYKYEDFDFERNIGTGNFSNVWYVTLKSNPTISYAIKIYNISNVCNKNYENFVKQERNSLICLNTPGHKNVIQLIDTFKDNTNLYLIYEYGIELWDLIKFSGSIIDEFACWLIHQIIDGLEYIHSKNIIHRDLKCENIIISQNNLKIIDFATSKFSNTNINTTTEVTGTNGTGTKDTEDTTVVPSTVTEENTNEDDAVTNSKESNTNTTTNNIRDRRSRRIRRYENYIGTPNFMDPKTISNIDNGYKRDIWSLGCIIYQIIVGRPPFNGSTEYFIIDRVKKFDIIFPEINPQAKDLILLLLNEDININFNEIRNHPFLKIPQYNCINYWKPLREICYKIGNLILKLQNKEIDENNFNNKFNTYIHQLNNINIENINNTDNVDGDMENMENKDMNKNILNRIINLMYWFVEQTNNEIIKEINEANKYLS